MKKGLIILAFLTILLVFSVSATWYEDTDCSTVSVCGTSPPDSSIGYGAVQIGSDCFTCGGTSDVVCPYEYGANCGACPDPECTGTLEGTVEVLDTGEPLSEATVTSFPFNQSTSSDLSAFNTGFYTMTTLAGTYEVRASKEGFDSHVQEVTVPYQDTATADFQLPNASCDSDCTDYYDRCNPACEGQKGCEYNSTEVMDLCAGKVAGSKLVLNASGENTTVVNCCIGDPFLEVRRKVNIQTKAKNVITNKISVTKDGEPVTLHVVVIEP